MLRLRQSKVEREEIIADFVFLVLSFIITVLLLFIFDIHWNFSPGGQLFPPEKHIFPSKFIYLWGGLLGAVIGFFLIKLFLFGLKEEEIVWQKEYNGRKK